MALKSLNQIKSLQDPMRQFQAEFTISDTPGLLLARLQQTIVGQASGNVGVASSEELRLRCSSFSYPSATIKQSSLIIGGFRRKLGTIQDKSGVWKCKVTEDQSGGVLNIIQSWCDLIHNNMTGIRVPSMAYVGTAEVKLEGLRETRTVWLKGFYPIKYTVQDIDPNSSNPLEVDIEFNYDYFSENSWSAFATIG